MTIARWVIFKTPLRLLLFLGKRCSTGGLAWATGPSGHALSDSQLALPRPSLTPTPLIGGRPTGGIIPQRGTLTDYKLVLTLAFTAFNCGHLHILFHNAHLLPIWAQDLLPIIYTGASLSDGSVKGQYVTDGLTPLKWICECFLSIAERARFLFSTQYLFFCAIFYETT